MSAALPETRGTNTVALVVSAFPKLSESFIADKFLGLVAAGWDVHVVCSHSAPREWNRITALTARPELRHRVHVNWRVHPRWLSAVLAPIMVVRCLLEHPVGTVRYVRGGFRRFGIRVLQRLYLDAELLVLRPAIVHFEFGTEARGRMYLRELLECKIVVSFRGFDLNYAGLDAEGFYDDVWRFANAVHCLGEDLWRRALRRGCPPTKERALIPPAVDIARFESDSNTSRLVRGASERPLRILSIGRLHWKKGYEYALGAIRELLDRGLACEYRIVGDGPHLEAVAFDIHDRGMEDVVVLLGTRSRDGIREELKRADVFLHAATSEGFCNAVLEAQAMGLPVVCTDADGLRENVADGVSGFVVEVRDVGGMAERLRELAADPAMRERMGRAGRARVRAQFPIDAQLAAFDALYHRVLHAEGSG